MYLPPKVSSDLGNDGAVCIRNKRNNKTVPVCNRIGEVEVEHLAEKYGSPLFVFDEQKILDTTRRMKKAFRGAYPNTVFCWSYKTNYLKAICNIFHKEGWLAEVVSDFEYQKAEKAGVRGCDIIYNGPGKSKESLVHAFEQGALVQIDNWDELSLVEEIVATLKRPVDVGIRIWLDTGIVEPWSKFGFSLDSGEASRAILQVLRNRKLRLHTLHSHIGTNIFVPEAYAVATKKLVALRDLVYRATKILIPCLNLGGGFPSSMKLHGMLDDFKIPPIEAYADAITGVLNRLPKKQRPQLRLETGRHLIDDAGYLITTIRAVKGMDRTSGAPDKGKQARGGYILDAGLNLLYLVAWCQINAMPTTPSFPELTNTVKLYGPLCMNIDVIRNEVELPPLEVNDRLVLHPVGAYNLTQSMQFINLRPTVVLVDCNESVHIIRQQEKLTDVEQSERVPTYLKLSSSGEGVRPKKRLRRAGDKP